MRTYCPIFDDTFWGHAIANPSDCMNMDAVGRALIDSGAFNIEDAAQLQNDAERYLNERIM
jgi:hypothetical protein